MLSGDAIFAKRGRQFTVNLALALAFLFFIGSVAGWVLELFFRRFFSSANPERKWINPGFCTGPYVPLYGFGLCIMFLIAMSETLPWIAGLRYKKLALFLVMAVAMTAIEYIAGLLMLKVAHVRLWDYSGVWGNIQSLICPKFSLIWAVMGAGYYFLIHPRIIKTLIWFSNNLAFSFFVGMFFGVFLIDMAHSLHLTGRIRKLAQEYDVTVRYESLKLQIKKAREERKLRYNFFAPFHTDTPLSEFLKKHEPRKK